MNQVKRMWNCADSQALEMFIGLYLMIVCFRYAWDLDPKSLTFAAGAFQAWAAAYGGLRARHWACGTVFMSLIFLGRPWEGILVACACLWAWYRTLLESKLS